MHPYYVVAKPSRWQLAIRAARRLAVGATVLAAHALLATAVFVLRTTRVIVTIAATLASWAELYLAQRTGKPAYGQTAGAGVAAAFTAEFVQARAHYAHAYATPAPEGAPQ